MQLPKISIVTPSFNQGQFLEKAILSVINQNYPNLEYILIDGGSSDQSLDIIEKYKEHFSFYCSEPDGGQSAGINKGFQKATGDLVAWMNSDDFYHPQVFYQVAEYWMNSDKKPGFIFGKGTRSDVTGEIQKPFSHSKPFFDYHALIYGIDYILQPCTFMNRQALQEVGFLNEKLHYCMDYDLWIRLAQKYPVLPIDLLIANSREYEDTKTNSGGFKRIEEIRQMINKYQDTVITPGVALSVVHELHAMMNANASTKELFSKDAFGAVQEAICEIAVALTVFSPSGDGWPIQNGDVEMMKNKVQQGQSVSARTVDFNQTPIAMHLEQLRRLCVDKDIQIEKPKELLDYENKKRLQLLETLSKEIEELNQTCEDRLDLINKLHREHQHAVDIIEKTENSLPFKIYRKIKKK